MSSAQEPDLTTPAVVAAHPAALMLLLVANRLHAKCPVRAISATVFEPASEHGQAAMDELHQQTVSLLSFQSLPREQYDAQVAFNLLPSLGDAAKVKLVRRRERIADHYAALSAGTAPELALQLVQAPVFHGYVASVLVELQEAATREQIEAAVHGEHVDVVGAESDPPSNLSAAGQPEILVRVERGFGQRRLVEPLLAVDGGGQSEAGGAERDCVRERVGAAEAAGQGAMTVEGPARRQV